MKINYKFLIIFSLSLLGGFFLSTEKAQAFNLSQFTSQSVSTTMGVGQTYPVSLTFVNTGTDTWTTALDYKLGSQNWENNTIWGLSRVALPNSVVNGNSVTFNFNVTAPAKPGTYNFQWRMLRESVEWFGDFSTNVSITVVAATLNVDLKVNGVDGPINAAYNSFPNLSWTSTGFTSCSLDYAASNGSSGPTGWTGLNQASAPNGPTLVDWYIFTLNCTGVNGNMSDSVTVNTLPSCTSATPDNDVHLANSGSRMTYANGVSSNVTQLVFQTWSAVGGTDDLAYWLAANNGGGNWSYDISLLAHPDVGQIYSNALMYTPSTGWTLCDSAHFTTVSTLPPATCSGVTPDGDWTTATSGTRLVTASGVSGSVTQVAMYAWSAAGPGVLGQGDMVTYMANNVGGGNWTYNIPLSSHTDLGLIYVHVYFYDPGVPGWVWCDSANFDRLNKGNIQVNSNISTGWSISCTLTNPICPSATPAGGLTSQLYTDLPYSSWTIIPNAIPGYSFTVTPSATQVFP